MYIKDWLGVIQKLKEILSPGCKVVFFEPNFFSPVTLARTIHSKLLRNSPTNIFSPLALKAELKAVNFDIEVYRYSTRNLPLTDNIMLGTNLKLSARMKG